MLKKLMYRLFGVGLLAFSAGTWSWMLGAFARLPTGGNAMAANWLNPGILAMPGSLSTIAGLVGLLYLLGVFPLFDTPQNQQTPS